MDKENMLDSIVLQSNTFKYLIREKKRFLLLFTICFAVFYVLLPVLTAYSKRMNLHIADGVTLAWLFAFVQFLMTWVLCMIYHKKAASFDKMVDCLREEVRSRKKK
ncbi:DUF485 domain-containing protein [Fodinisporobacter ferrooxydans]|uniref:DUF485 domain-containing protein n=1 Tax=Fodinisporobacter ferrooxydans TaxID=2901836 RepID=A0ABY4CHI5_9BACL|nr:DUF485 domain-containing protein [Alicyclobacillaceae bacterium MYW30-H2]